MRLALHNLKTAQIEAAYSIVQYPFEVDSVDIWSG